MAGRVERDNHNYKAAAFGYHWQAIRTSYYRPLWRDLLGQRFGDALSLGKMADHFTDQRYFFGIWVTLNEAVCGPIRAPLFTI